MKRIDAVRELYFNGYKPSIAECLVPCTSIEVSIVIWQPDKEYTLFNVDQTPLRSNYLGESVIICNTLEELKHVIHS